MVGGSPALAARRRARLAARPARGRGPQAARASPPPFAPAIPRAPPPGAQVGHGGIRSDFIVLQKRKQESERLKMSEAVKEDFKRGAYAQWEQRTDGVIRRRAVQQRFDSIRAADKQLLIERRRKLSEMLRAEDEAFERQIEALGEGPEARRERMESRARELRNKREETRRTYVQEQLDRQWRLSCDPLRNADSANIAKACDAARGYQIEERMALLELEQQEEKVFADMWVKDAEAKERREAEEEAQRRAMDEEQMRILARQVRAESGRRRNPGGAWEELVREEEKCAREAGARGRVRGGQACGRGPGRAGGHRRQPPGRERGGVTGPGVSQALARARGASQGGAVGLWESGGRWTGCGSPGGGGAAVLPPARAWVAACGAVRSSGRVRGRGRPLVRPRAARADARVGACVQRVSAAAAASAVGAERAPPRLTRAPPPLSARAHRHPPRPRRNRPCATRTRPSASAPPS